MSYRIHDPATLAAHYRLNGHALDSSGHNNHGTLFNAPTWGVFNRGLKTAIELDGNDQHVNCGDITALNAVAQFTICFWMWQDVLDVTDVLFIKVSGADLIEIDTNANGNMYCRPSISGSNRGFFDYSAVVSVANWHHVAWVFDGTQAANASRLVVYVDGAPIALGFDGTIAAVTANLAGIDAFIGYSSTSFDGLLYDSRIYNVAVSRDEINAVIHDPISNL